MGGGALSWRSAETKATRDNGEPEIWLTRRRVGLCFQGWREKKRTGKGRRREARGWWRANESPGEWLGGLLITDLASEVSLL